MTKMEFGVFDESVNNYFRSVPEAADIFERSFREVQLEEELGFGYHFVVEHQGNSAGQCTSPSTLLAVMAQCTSTIRLGSMIFLVPFHNPLRLAQDTATVDQISRGRLEFGAGVGALPHEFERWNIPYSERREITTEAMEIIKTAWTGEIFSYEGKYWQFDEALPMPRSYQKPHPPIWFMGRSDDTLKYAVDHKYGVGIFLETDTRAAETLGRWRQFWRESEQTGPMPPSFITRAVYVAETDEQAREEAAPYLVQNYTWGEDRLEQTRLGGQFRHNLTRKDRPGLGAADFFHGTTTGIDFWLKDGFAHVGSPETVIRRLKAQQELIGFDLFGGSFRFGPMPDELVEKSLRLFGEKVIPAFS